jgi:hypothetical protein
MLPLLHINADVIYQQSTCSVVSRSFISSFTQQKLELWILSSVCPAFNDSEQPSVVDNQLFKLYRGDMIQAYEY